ncbi:MAG: hypothetical protein RMY28_031120 [Nostoc sp. ChiSLP01]
MPDLAAENQTFRTLSQHLKDEPQLSLKTLAQIGQGLCQGDSAVVSLRERQADG